MSAIDVLVNEVESRFGLNNATAESLLGSLFSIIQEQRGGLNGFLERFRRAGLSNTVSAWLNGASTPAITPDNLEAALGKQTLSNIATRNGLSLATVTSAVGFMVPKLVQSLAPGGAIPTRLPMEAMSYVSGATGMMAAEARQAVRKAESGSRRWLGPLLALIAAVLLFSLWPRSRSAAFNAQDQIRVASDKAAAALAALRPGYAPQDLTNALNLEIINFDTASAQIPDYSTSFLNKAAEAIKFAPAGMAIEVGGHTDNVGNSAVNLALSQQRANAVVNYLVQRGVPASQLTARGYGDTQPIASNETEEGRFRNRRIEFSAH